MQRTPNTITHDDKRNCSKGAGCKAFNRVAVDKGSWDWGGEEYAGRCWAEDCGRPPIREVTSTSGVVETIGMKTVVINIDTRDLQGAEVAFEAVEKAEDLFVRYQRLVLRVLNGVLNGLVVGDTPPTVPAPRAAKPARSIGAQMGIRGEDAARAGELIQVLREDRTAVKSLTLRRSFMLILRAVDKDYRLSVETDDDDENAI